MFPPTAFLLALVVVSHCANLPPSFKKCNRKDPDLDKCLLEAAQNGVPQMAKSVKDLHLPNVNPFEVPKVDIGGKGAVAVEQHFQNCKIFGLHLVKIRVFHWDINKRTLDIKGVFPELKKLCHYKLEGQVLLLPIRGEGSSTVILYNTTFDAHLGMEGKRKKNKTFLKIVSTDFDFEPEFVHFNFENLFDGDKILGDNINEVLNDNWREVFEDVKDGYLRVIVEVAVGLLNSFLSKFSEEDLLD